MTYARFFKRLSAPLVLALALILGCLWLLGDGSAAAAMPEQVHGDGRTAAWPSITWTRSTGTTSPGTGAPARPGERSVTPWARSSTPGSEIRVAPGVYNLALGESFPLSMNPGVSLSGAGYTTTVIWGDVANPAVLFPSSEIFTDSTSFGGFKIANSFSGVTVEGRATDYPTPVIENNWITGNDRGYYSLLSDDQQDHSIIRNNLISENGTHGIFSYVSDDLCVFGARIEGNRIENNGTDGVRCRAFDNQGGSDLAYCTPTIVGNVIVGNGSDGIDCKTGNWGVCNLAVRHNVIAGNAYWGMHRIHENSYSQTSVAQVINNLIHGNGEGGALFITVDSTHRDMPMLVNNTIADNNLQGVVGGLPTIVNSIVWGHGDDLDAPLGQVSYSDIGEAAYAGVNNNISADPRFVNPALGDYHVLPTSPVVDSGNSGHGGVPPADLDGDSRILGLGVEMGADESQAYAVSIAKAVAPEGVVLPGGLLTYTLTVTSESGHSAAGVLVTDTSAGRHSSGMVSWSRAPAPRPWRAAS